MTVLIHTAQVEVVPRETGMPRESLLSGWIMRAALNSHSQDTGISYLNPQVQASSYTHKEMVLRHCDSHPLLLQLLPNTLLPSLLSAMSTSRFSGLSVPVCRNSRVQLALCSAGCPRTAPYNVKPRQPCGRVTPSLMTCQMQHCWCSPVHSSSFPAGVNMGREWVWANSYVAIEFNSTATIILKVIVTLCWGLVVRNYSIQTTC